MGENQGEQDARARALHLKELGEQIQDKLTHPDVPMGGKHNQYDAYVTKFGMKDGSPTKGKGYLGEAARQMDKGNIPGEAKE